MKTLDERKKVSNNRSKSPIEVFGIRIVMCIFQYETIVLLQL
jgi:hypothetical protein